MRFTAFFVAVFYLYGCTAKVIELAKGIKESEISNSAVVNSAWLDPVQNEFIICMIDYGNFPNKVDHYLLSIPKDLIDQEENEKIEFVQRTILEPAPEKENSWWSLFLRERKDIKVYDLTLYPNYHCVEPKKNWDKVAIVKAPKDLTSDEVLYFRGDTINKNLSKNLPFLVFAFAPDSRFINASQKNVCKLTGISERQPPCFLLVSRIQLQDKYNPQLKYNEILSVERFIWGLNPKPLWYLALPFAVIADFVIIGLMGAGRN